MHAAFPPLILSYMVPYHRVQSPTSPIMLPHESLLSPTSSFNVKDSHKELPSRGVARSRSVNFTPEKEQVVVEFDMVTEEERDTFWYSTDEYQIIKARNR